MCFTERITYYCGHGTVACLRPCPMTTQLPTNPVCSKPMQRDTQLGWMCPTCARVLHARWVDIIQYEHQFMHERGTCGCPVVFPALQQPRVVSKPSSDHQNQLASTAVGVQVRVASQYGAEWIADHRALHEDDRCHCNVSFDTYKGVEFLDQSDDDATVVEAESQPDFVTPTPYQAVLPILRKSDITMWKMNEAPNKADHVPWPTKPEDYGFKTAAEAEQALEAADALNDEIGGPSASTSSNVLTPITSVSDGSGKWSTSASDNLPMPPTDAALDVIVPDGDEVPIIALPIGAGPEGGLENSHVPHWSTCELAQKRLPGARSMSAPAPGSN